ncbi:MAG: PAS domain S-box protein [Desulfatiglans sp.]|jgi:two-component system NtrC family sensor kinase|nr:PAS domain S-box protein [Thermodesulfobacteriota bacterium]MEE4352600.1 PAS domain S-box protein [Desulfatiglans sp.]
MMVNGNQELVDIFEGLEDGVYLINHDYVLEFMSRAMIEDFGDGIGGKCFKVMYGLDHVCPWCRAEEVFQGNEVLSERYAEDEDRIYGFWEVPIKKRDGSIAKFSVRRDITQNKENDLSLKTSEKDYRRLFQNVGCGVYISSREGEFLDANPALLKMLGYESKSEFLEIDIGKDLYLRPEDRRQFQRMIEQEGHVIDYEVDFKKKDGTPIPVLLTANVRYDQNGRVLGYEGIIVDKSQQKRMEKVIKASEEDFKRLFEHVGAGVYISSKEGRFLDANPALLKMLGYESKSEFLEIDIGKDLYLRPEDRRQFQRMIEQEGRVIDYEVDFKRKDGTAIPVIHTGHVRYDQDGKILGYEGINVDLSHRKRMERELKEAHDFLNKIIQNSPNAIMATDLDGNIMIWNHGAEEILGYLRTDVVGKMDIEKIYPEGMAKKIMQMLRSNEHGGIGRLKSYPLVCTRQDGGIVEGNLSAAIIYDSKGEETATVGILVDLKERLEIERKLRQTQEQLLQSEKLAAMGRLTSQIAHELNNPLYGIMNTLELMKTEIAPDNRRRKILEMALSETVRLSDMLRKMLSFSKPEEEKRQPTDVNTILDEILMMHEKQLRENNIKISRAFAQGLGNVCASRDQLRQVFLNLVSNAKDAMPEGGTLAVETREKEGSIHIQMTDTGTGIKKQDIGKVFETFFTTKESIKGVGLGLSVCYGFIKDHGGDIRVESEYGSGTTFTITLPIHRENPE